MNNQFIIKDFLANEYENILKIWEDMVNLEGTRFEEQAMTKVANFIKAQFEEVGMEMELIPTYPGIAPYVYGVLNKESTKEPIIFSGHFDTVYKKGHFGDNPFRIEDGKAYGPGALDMKGGIVISLFVIKALKKIGYTDRPIKVFFFSDEEGPPLAGNTRPIHLLQEKINSGVCAFNMETGLPDNKLCTSRKSAVSGNITITGVSAHSGANFTDGKSAIEEMAHKIIEVQSLTQLDKGIIVSIGVVQGGTAMNTVADNCQIDFSMRFVRKSDAEETIKKIEDICSKSVIEGTKISFAHINNMDAFECSEDVVRLYEFLEMVSKDTDAPLTGHVHLGGGSDASKFSNQGIPVICAGGVPGMHNHSPREVAYVDGMLNRIELYYKSIMRIEEFVK